MTDAAPAGPPLASRTVELDRSRPLDLLAVAGPAGFLFEQEGHGLAGRGEAARIDLPAGLDGVSAVADLLAGVETTGAGPAGTGAGPVAVGALPFDRGAPATMVVPALVARRTPDGRQWLTTVGRGRAPGPPLWPEEGGGPAVELPDGFTLSSPRSHRDWRATVARAVDAVATGRMAKVVVAREVVVRCNRAIVVTHVLDRLRTLYPGCLTFSVDGFVGASPELLVSRFGPEARSHPLAGTYPRSGDAHADRVMATQLMDSPKERREHAFAVDEISSRLGPVCEALDVPTAPRVMALRNVVHLGTEITGRLAPPVPTALELAALLHPTPAVGGAPTPEALAWLADNEGLDRGRYAGPVGWVAAGGDGMFSVGIRSAEVDGDTARLFAGVGVVEGSDPRRELIESQLKLQALLAALVLP